MPNKDTLTIRDGQVILKSGISTMLHRGVLVLLGVSTVGILALSDKHNDDRYVTKADYEKDRKHFDAMDGLRWAVQAQSFAELKAAQLEILSELRKPRTAAQ